MGPMRLKSMLTIFLFGLFFQILESQQDMGPNPSLPPALKNQHISRSESLNQYINATFHCSEMEKICLQNKRVLHVPSSKCYRVPDTRPCDKGIFVVSKQSFVKEMKMIGKCLQYCNASTSGTDEECIPSEDCPFGDGNKNVFGGQAEDMFGERMCCNEDSCSLHAVSQPIAEQTCALSNIKHDSVDYHPDSWKIDFLKCTERDLECFEKNMIHHLAEGCVKPLEKCENDGKWQADKNKWKEELRLEAVCVSSLCSSGGVFLAEEQRCVSAWEMENVFCAGDNVFFDIFGEAFCDRYNFDQRLLNLSLVKNITNGLCKVLQEPAYAFANRPNKACVENNSGHCVTDANSEGVNPQTYSR